MMSVFISTCKREFEEILHSPYRLALVFFIPLAAFVFVGAVFVKETATKLPIALIDKDASKLSRELVFHINATQTLKVAHKPTSLREARRLLGSAKVYAVVVIPQKFEKKVRLGEMPQVEVMLNTQYILVSKIVKSALLEAVMGSGAEVEFVKNLSRMQNYTKSVAALQPLRFAITPLFNETKNYYYFLVSALIPSLWQIFIVIAVIVSFGSVFKEHREKEVFERNTLLGVLFGKLFPYTVIFSLWGFAFVYVLFIGSGWGVSGSLWVMFGAVILTVLAYEAVALFLFVLSFDYARTLSLGAVVTAPAFAFLGVTFPVESMNGFAQFIRSVLPISYYMELQIAQVSLPLELDFVFEKLFGLSLFLLLFGIVYFRIKQRLGL